MLARTSQWVNGAVEFWRAAWDFVYPPMCLMCSSEIPSQAELAFCPDCQLRLAPRIADACDRCGAPVGPNLDTELGCHVCRTTPFHFDRILRLGIYEDLLRRACLSIKQSGREPLARTLAEFLWFKEQPQLEALNITRVVSVPRYWLHRIWQGRNPSEVLAEQLAKRLKTVCDVRQVWKTQWTPKQASLPVSRRRSNLQKAFRLRHPQRIKDQNILLVDDVLTTGTTANRIAKLLRKAGAKSITVAIIARGLGDAR